MPEITVRPIVQLPTHAVQTIQLAIWMPTRVVWTVRPELNSVEKLRFTACWFK